MRARFVRGLVPAGLVLSFVACGSFFTAPTPVAVTLTVSRSTVAVGQMTQLSALVLFTDSGVLIDVTPAATWQSANPGVAIVSATGVVTGVAAGMTTITATYVVTTIDQTATGSAPLTVSP
jgi:uncharacterized protein YjdB